jgi:DNA adenine methylase
MADSVVSVAATGAVRTGIKKPVLRYYGGKFRLAPWVISHFPAHRRYVEPFGGAASVLLLKQPAYTEIYNDLDRSMFSFFSVVRDPVQCAELERLLRSTPYSRDEFVLAREPAEDAIEAARRLCVRSYMGYGTSGLRCRDTGFRTEFNDLHKLKSQLISFRSLADRLPEIRERLVDVLLENRPASELMALIEDDQSLIYCDPPYPLSARSGKSKEYEFEMDDDEHAEIVEQLRVHPSMIAVSGYPGSVYDSLGWDEFERPHFTLMGAVRSERLWLNPLASERLGMRQLDLFGEFL